MALRIEEDWDEIDKRIEDDRELDSIKGVIILFCLAGLIYWLTVKVCIWIMGLMYYRPEGF